MVVETAEKYSLFVVKWITYYLTPIANYIVEESE